MWYWDFPVACPAQNRNFAHVRKAQPTRTVFLNKFVLSCWCHAMPVPYSLDLRWRVVWLSLTRRYSAMEISQLLHLSERTVRRYITINFFNKQKMLSQNSTGMALQDY